MKHTLESLLALAESDDGRQQIRVIVAELVGWKPTAHWWCPKCQSPVISRDVTNDERHDVRHGGCGAFVETDEPMGHYHASLDAIMPEVRKLDEGEKARFLYELERVCMIAFSHNFTLCRAMLDAEAIHLCIAFILTKQP